MNKGTLATKVIRYLGYALRIVLGLYTIAWCAACASLLPDAYSSLWEYPWQFADSPPVIPFLIGAVPLQEIALAALSVMLLNRFSSESKFGWDIGLFLGGLSFLLFRTLFALFIYGVMRDAGPADSLTREKSALCGGSGCPPLDLASALQYLPALTLAVAMIVVAIFYSDDRPWWKRITAILLPYVVSILAVWPIWAIKVWPIIGPP